MLESEKINLITHENISRSHLNWGGLHLNKRGDAALAHNFIETIRNVPGSGCYTVDIYCTAALTSLADSVSYIKFLFSEWRILSKSWSSMMKN